MIEKLLDILLTEMIEEEKQSVRDNLTYCLCTHSVEMNPNEIDSTKTYLKSEDDNRYYVGITTKRGVDLVVPLNKRYFRDGRIKSLKCSFS